MLGEHPDGQLGLTGTSATTSSSSPTPGNSVGLTSGVSAIAAGANRTRVRSSRTAASSAGAATSSGSSGTHNQQQRRARRGRRLERPRRGNRHRGRSHVRAHGRSLGGVLGQRRCGGMPADRDQRMPSARGHLGFVEAARKRGPPTEGNPTSQKPMRSPFRQRQPDVVSASLHGLPRVRFRRSAAFSFSSFSMRASWAWTRSYSPWIAASAMPRTSTGV